MDQPKQNEKAHEKEENRDKKLRIQSAKPGINSRQMDNHYDAKIHNKPWIAPGIFPQIKMVSYEHNDSGLGVVSKKIEKFKNFKELHEINEQINNIQQQQKNFRKFKEFDSLQDGELIVTIEYCTNCSQHSGSTRHDEEKYYNNAILLKQEVIASYPISKVYLKPLIYDPTDASIDSLYIQRRIGAFEIQACSKNRGQVKKGVVFSKLTSKRWPQFSEVINDIVQYLSTSKLDIYVKFDGGEVGQTKDIQVMLTPYRSQLQQRSQSRQSLGNTTLMSQQEQCKENLLFDILKEQRPQSGVSKKSAQSKRSMKPAQQERRYVEKTNQNGIINIQEIPIDVYVLEVQESNDFQAESFLLNMFEMQENNQEMSVIVNLKKQNYSYLEIRVQNSIEGIIYGAKIEVFHQENEQSIQAQESRQGGSYEIVLEPGIYIIKITKRGFKEFNSEFSAKKVQGVNKLSFEIEKSASNEDVQNKPPNSAQLLKPLQQESQQQQKKQSAPQQQQQQQQRGSSAGNRPTSAARSQNQSSTSQLVDNKQQQQQQQQPVKQQQQQQQSSISQQEEEPKEPIRPISGLKTTMIFIYDPYTNLPIPNVSVKLNEDSTKKTTSYLTEEDGTCKLILQNVLEGKLVIECDGYFSITEEYGTSQSKMNLYQLRELSFPLISKPKDPNQVQVLVQTNVEAMPVDVKMISPENVLINDNDKFVHYDYNEESGCLKITILDLNQKRGVYRIYADILEPEYLHPQTLKLYVVNSKELKLVDVPKGFTEVPRYWDIGVVCAPNIDFLEINCPTAQELGRDKFLKDYQELINFIKNSKNMDLKTLLGFNDKDKLEVQGDEKIKSSLDKYGFESMKNLDYLIASAMMPNGLYSFKRLEAKFSKLDFEFIFENENSTSKQKEEEEDEPYDEDYEL